MAENMPRIKMLYALSLSCLLGIAIGSLLIPDLRLPNKTPVFVDFCFFARNPDLFESRRFITYGFVSSAQPHGYVLDNPSCADQIVSFTKQLETTDYAQELSDRFRNAPYAPVPVVFEAALDRSSLLRNFWYSAQVRRGLSGDPSRRVIIRAFKAVGEQKWNSSIQRWVPASR